MMMRTTRMGSSVLARLSSRGVNVPRRTFAASTAVRADAITELYVKELKAYKVPQEKPGEADAHVQKFNPPKTPKSPEESSLASQMQEYENQTVEIEGQSASGESSAPTEESYFEDLETTEGEHAAH